MYEMPRLFVVCMLCCYFQLVLPKDIQDANLPSHVSEYIFTRNHIHSPYSSKDNELQARDVVIKSYQSSYFNTENEVSFYIYTKKNPNIPQKLIINDVNGLKRSDWIAGLPTKMYVHGWAGNHTIPQMVAMKNRFLENDERSNVIALDWGPIAGYIYPIAAHYSEDVGKVGSKFIDFLCENGARPEDFHVIGLSLGAHIAGFVGSHVKRGKIARVTGLDPASYGFITEGPDGRIDKSDADFVDCIHTCGGTVGFMKPLCHADYYVNKGFHPQPGCPDSWSGYGCSHVRAQDYFTESIESGHIFPALTCQTLTKYGPNDCYNDGALMGYPAEKKFNGLFSVKTGSEYPFSSIK